MEIVCGVHEFHEGVLFAVNKPHKCFAIELVTLAGKFLHLPKGFDSRSAKFLRFQLAGMWLSGPERVKFPTFR